MKCRKPQLHPGYSLKAIFIFFLLGSCFNGFSQTKFKHSVYLKSQGKPSDEKNQKEKEMSGYKIFEIKSLTTNDTLNLLKNYTLTKSKEMQIKGTKYELSKDSTILKDTNITFKTKKAKAERFYFDKGCYKANLSISKDTILVNFWLWELNDTSWYNATEAQKKKFPFNPETKYFIKLNNRQYESFFYTNWELALLTIPFKYHFGFKESDAEIDPVFNTNINISTLIGKRLGKVSYVYDTYKGMTENNWSATIGGFIGLSSQKVDSTSTSLATSPILKETNIPALSYGLGVVFNISDFNLGVFMGWDNGIGSLGQKWNFDNKPWFGFGFGYKLAFLGKPE
jgi:hypothetical protein